MSTNYDVIVYGASGYTGKLISWHLAEANIPFVAAGRSQKRLEEQMATIAELEGASYQIKEVAHDEVALTELFKGRKIVYNVVGPFMEYGEVVVRAALNAGCHYLDTTGEADWMRFIRDKYGADFEKAGLLLSPANSYMWATGALATEIALETPGIDTLEVLYLADSATSVASTQSFMRMCTVPQYYLEHNELVMWPYAVSYSVLSPDSHRIFSALPWSGAGEAVWYEKDERVSNCSTLVAFRNELMFGAVIGALEEFETKHRHKQIEEHDEIKNKMAAALVSEEPERENPDQNRSVISCIGRGNGAGVKVVLRGNSPYIQTAILAAESCRRILDGHLLATGFQPSVKAFGARELMAALAEHGTHVWDAQITV